MDVQSDIKRLFSLISSSIVVSDDLIEKLERIEKFLPESKLIPKDCIIATGTVNRLLNISLNLASKISVKSKMIEKINVQYEESLQQLEKKYDSYLFEKSILLKLIKTHQEDKKHFVKQFIQTGNYSSSMTIAEELSTNTTNTTNTKNTIKKISHCNICLEDLLPNCDLAILQCGHFFHKDCAIEWLSENKSECTHCNKHIVPTELSTLEKFMNSLDEDSEKIEKTIRKDEINNWNIKVSKKRSRSNSYNTASYLSDLDLEVTVHDSLSS
jgi:hypothetical protein